MYTAFEDGNLRRSFGAEINLLDEKTETCAVLSTIKDFSTITCS